MQVVFINECKSCEISNQMFFNIFSILKTKVKLVMTRVQINVLHFTICDTFKRTCNSKKLKANKIAIQKIFVGKRKLKNKNHC